MQRRAHSVFLHALHYSMPCFGLTAAHLAVRQSLCMVSAQLDWCHLFWGCSLVLCHHWRHECVLPKSIADSISSPTTFTSPNTVTVTAEVFLIMRACTTLYSKAIALLHSSTSATPALFSMAYSLNVALCKGTTACNSVDRSNYGFCEISLL